MPLLAGWPRVGSSPQPQTLVEMTVKPPKVTVGGTGKLPLVGSRDIDDRRRSLGGDLGEFQIGWRAAPASSVKVAPHLTLRDGLSVPGNGLRSGSTQPDLASTVASVDDR
jgi:hypothetical protein